jgi:hypothetical protein
MPRPYIQKTVFELQELHTASQGNPAELKRLLAELSHRKLPKAKALADKVKTSLEALKHSTEKERPKEQPKEPPASSSPTHKIVACQKCEQRLRIELSEGQREQRCPTCKTSFTTSYQDGVLSIVFEGAEPENGTKQNEPPVTLEVAYQLFNADKGTAWEEIELTRRRLLQQYHPDKVAALGPKLRELAESEGKCINVAFDLLRKTRGL